ncbi:DUF5983 family protein [Enterobacter ludwigii]|uniref:DUF5983 family protein n=1 Tax=Enterobacter ludwigii TaxID=299767 RepID=UPI000A5DE2EA|nr:DUF5983 family protein [Enterobacter ludwigii]
MKIDLNFSADSINVLALNMTRIAVELDGIDIAELVDAPNKPSFLTSTHTPAL